MKIPSIFINSFAGLRRAGQGLATRANNIANANTPGFRPQTPDEARSPEAATQNTLFHQGPLQPSSNPLDLGIDGFGFFLLQDDQQQNYLSRVGDFHVNSDGQLENSAGLKLQGFSIDQNGTTAAELENVTVARNGEQPREIEISSNGTLSATFSDGEPTDLFQIPLAGLTNHTQVSPESQTLFKVSSQGGQPFNTFQATQSGFGRIESGTLESSSVDLAEELIGMTIEEIAFRANLRSISVADDLLGEIINLKKK